MSTLDTNPTKSGAARLSLPLLLRLDMATCLAMAALLIAAAGPVAGLTAVPEGLLRGAGLALLPVAALMWLTASGRLPGRLPVAVIVLGNLVWAAASVALACGAFVAPNTLGIAFLLAQASVVAVFAVLEARA